MRVFLIATMIALTALPAYSQGRLEGRSIEEQNKEDEQRRAASAEVERSAKSALERAHRGQQQQPHDPWGTIRGAEPAKSQRPAR